MKEGIKPPSSWWQRSIFNWVGVLCIRVEDVDSLQILTWRGTYLLQPPFWSCKPWPSSVSSCVSHGIHHLMASMGSDIIPSAKCTWSGRCPHQLHITWSLHLSSVDAVVEIHGRSHNFPLIHPREVLLAEHWVTTQPLFSYGIIISSLPLEVCLHGVGLVHMPHAWQTPIHKGMPTSDVMRRSQFW